MSKEYEDAIQKTIEAMINKMNNQVDVYLMADLKRMSDNGVLEIQQGQPEYTPIFQKDIHSVGCELPIRLYFKGEETINNLQSKLSELERENERLKLALFETDKILADFHFRDVQPAPFPTRSQLDANRDLLLTNNTNK